MESLPVAIATEVYPLDPPKPNGDETPGYSVNANKEGRIDGLVSSGVVHKHNKAGLPVAIPAGVDPLVPPGHSRYGGSTSIHSNKAITDDRIELLVHQGYTRNLAQSLNETKMAMALRIWIVDNSASMNQNDAHRLTESSSISSEGVKMVHCSRWEEIRDCLEYHLRLAALIEAPTRVRFLNHPGANVGPQQLSIAEGSSENISLEMEGAVSVLRKARPRGCTPLTQHILEIRAQVASMAPALVEAGKRVAVIIATDGLPTNEWGYGGKGPQKDFVDSVKSLEGLPVFVVIRLSTDEQDVVNYYNELDAVLELSIEVLDDFAAEAREVYMKNPWLNYSLAIHRLREVGYQDSLFDLLDERPFTASEIKEFCVFLLGEEGFDGSPDPSADPHGFVKHVTRLLSKEAGQWNPITRRTEPSININKLPCALHVAEPSWFESLSAAIAMAACRSVDVA